MDDEPLTADKVAYIAEWLRGIEQELEDESISLSQIVEIDRVYDVIKEEGHANDQPDIA